MPAAHPTRGTVEDDAVDLLVDDHEQSAELFDRYESLVADGAPAGDRETLAKEICSLLVVHAALKEELFYPAAREVIDEEYLIDEALIAQDSALSLIDEIQSGDPTEPRYDTQMAMLHELFTQSFEEERAELFPRVRATALDLEELGSEMSARQEVLLSIDGDDETA